MSMTLAQLLEDPLLADAQINDLVEDSRAVRAGDAFIAVAGDVSDGHLYVAEAVAAGAACVISEREVDASVPLAVVENLRSKRGELAARFYGNPSADLTCAAVTGTNGKTSVAFHIAELASLCGRRCGYMGTVGWGQVPDLKSAQLTTEVACTLQRRLARLREDGCAWAALEASSHALEQRRLDGVHIQVAVFTNLTRDHLDYHEDFEAYARAKRRLFDFQSVRCSVICCDDDYGAGLAEALRARGDRVLTYGEDGDIRFVRHGGDATHQRGSLQTPWGSRDVVIPLLGCFSATNVMAAVGVLADAGMALDALAGAIEKLTPVPGRLEQFPIRDGALLVVDFAHTPDALTKALLALRPHCTSRLICVVGCGGDRDRGKRPQMARAAELGADVVWLTSDNPRSEDPAHIIDDMRAGLGGTGCVHECIDRRDAIQRAVTASVAGDVVLIAGKGHEDYQEVSGGRYAYSDRDVARTLSGGRG